MTAVMANGEHQLISGQCPLVGSRGIICHCEARSNLDHFCHREERGDLALVLSKHPLGVARNYLSLRGTKRSRLSAQTNREKRDCRASLAYLSSRGTWRSRLFRAGKQRKERLLRRGSFCHREGRGDLGCSGLANREKRDCRAALAMTGYPS